MGLQRFSIDFSSECPWMNMSSLDSLYTHWLRPVHIVGNILVRLIPHQISDPSGLWNSLIRARAGHWPVKMKSYGNLCHTCLPQWSGKYNSFAVKHHVLITSSYNFLSWPNLPGMQREFPWWDLCCHGVWLWRVGSVAPPIVMPRLLLVHRRTKIGTHVHHDQTYKKPIWTHTLSPTGSQPFWCVAAFLTNSSLLWKLSCSRAYTPQSSHSLSVIFMPWRTKVMEINQLCQTWWAWRRTPFLPFAVKPQILNITSTYNFLSTPNCS